MIKNTLSNSYLNLLVAVIAFLIYSNSLVNGLALDDHSVILDNRISYENALSLFTMVDAVADAQKLPFYRPLTNLTFLYDGRLHGYNPLYIRLFNILVHSANTLLVYRLCRTLFNEKTLPSLLATLLFAVHPIHTEAVNFNAGGRITIMACFFSLAAYQTHRECILHNKKSLSLLGALLFLSGLFSKEVALMILPFILALEITPFRSTVSGTRLQSITRLIPYFSATAIYLIMRWSTLSKLGIQAGIIPGIGTNILEAMYVTTDFSTRMLNNIYIIPSYLWTAIAPIALANRYMVPEDLNILALPLFISWIFILSGLTWILTKGRSTASLFGIAWIIFFWLPVSGIVFVPGAQQADRFIYIPAIGLWIILSDQTFKIFPIENKKIRCRVMAVITLILVTLSALTVRRNMDWKSNLTLYSRFVEQYPDNVHARVGLGKAYYNKGKDHNADHAEREFEKVITMDPNFPDIFTYLGNLKLNREDLSGAMYNYSKAIEVYPYDKEARLNRAITLEKLGRPKEALTDYLFYLTSPGTFENIPGGREYAEKRLRILSQQINQ